MGISDNLCIEVMEMGYVEENRYYCCLFCDEKVAKGVIYPVSIKWRKSVNQHSIAVRRSLAELEELVVDPSISDEVKELAHIDIEKLQYMRDYFEWLDRLVDAFEDHDIFNLVPIKKPQRDTSDK